jgi:hypothetical protein
VCFSAASQATNFRLDADYREKSVRAAAADDKLGGHQRSRRICAARSSRKKTPANLWTNQAVKNKALCAVSNSSPQCHSLGNRPPSWAGAFSEHKKSPLLVRR